MCAMPEFQGLPRAVLMAISRASGETYRDIDGAELMAELGRMGHEPDPIGLHNLMFRLRDSGYVEFHAAFGNDPAGLALIRLGEAGRQEVEGWPRSPGVSAADVDALIAAFEAHANNPDVPESERRTASTAASAARDLGVDVAGGVITSWLRSIGIG